MTRRKFLVGQNLPFGIFMIAAPYLLIITKLVQRVKGKQYEKK
ncbi:hypothetical protein [Niallia sp. 03133]